MASEFRARLRHAYRTITGCIPLSHIQELEIMADANDISTAAAALNAKLSAYVAQSQANYTALQAAETAASNAADQAVTAINAAAAAVPDVTTIGGTDTAAPPAA